MIQQLIKLLTRHKPEYFNKKRVAFLPIKEQATFADQICKKNVLNEDFLQDQFNDFDPDTADYSGWNITSIGNVAYIALYGKNQKIKAICLNALLSYKEYILSFS